MQNNFPTETNDKSIDANKNLFVSFLSPIFLGLIIFDQLTKHFLAGRNFYIGPVHVRTVKNFGLSFSVDFGSTINSFLIGSALLLFFYLYFRHRNIWTRLQQLAFAFIFAGAISNLIDRIVLGYVRDFISSGVGFTFNFADMFVVIGIILFLIQPKFKLIA
ncbi:MAG: signal peptidase II [Candidatus Doudnabacteria bacterium]|nr:signal peptidase II [Candidatus Doudnabacteria bacterium]